MASPQIRKGIQFRCKNGGKATASTGGALLTHTNPACYKNSTSKIPTFKVN